MRVALVITEVTLYEDSEKYMEELGEEIEMGNEMGYWHGKLYVATNCHKVGA